MKDRLRNGIALSLIPQIILVKWLGSYPEIIEAYYSQGFYPEFSGFFRGLLGWIPFSVGDLAYISLVFLCVRYLILKRNYIRKYPKAFIRNVIMVLSVAYFTFHLLWGFNYYRQPISDSLGLQENQNREELINFTENLIVITNKLQLKIAADSTKSIEAPYPQEEIFQKTLEGYDDLKKKYPQFVYHRPSIKKSLFSTMLTYMGYSGYLNPFTNEAQVNRLLPNFRFPVVAAHEIGHQIGYSAENETNFVGYLVTLNNPDPYFKYSAQAYALGYCLREIKRIDEPKFQELYLKLNPGIVKNYQNMNSFWMAYENPLEPVFKSMFSTFLKANNQAEGIDSYNLVVSLLVAYHKKYPLE